MRFLARMAADPTALAVALVEAAVGSAVQRSASRHVAGAVASAALRAAWQMVVGTVAGAPQLCEGIAGEEHGAAEPCEDNKFELLLQDRLKLVEVPLRAQLIKAWEIGFDVHSAKGARAC